MDTYRQTLEWTSPDNPNVVLQLKSSMSDGDIGSRDSFELSNGNLVVYWSQNMPNVPRSDGTPSSDYLFARVINPETGEFVSEELLQVFASHINIGVGTV